MVNFIWCASALGSDVLNLFWQTGLVAKLVILILLIFSLLSWSIILGKWGHFKRARVQSSRFLRAYRKTQRLSEIAAVGEQFAPSPLVGVLQGGYEELRKGGKLGAVQRACSISTSEEMTRLERRMPWLATTGAVTPFIGLFGTVWGIIDAFQGLGTTGAASLRAVAPGISEALITTAAGLFAAIPAVIAYNLLNNQIREFGARMDDFTLELANTIERAQPGPRAVEPEHRS